MLRGNWLLHGWTLTDVSFYTTELPEYIGLQLVHQVDLGLVHLAAALTYTLLVLMTALLARGPARGGDSSGGEGLARALVATESCWHRSSGPACSCWCCRRTTSGPRCFVETYITPGYSAYGRGVVEAAILTFGRPAHVYHYRAYIVMVWNANLLDRIGPPLRQ